MNPDYPRPQHPMQSELVTTFESGVKVKRRVPRMRACDELNGKGKACLGHLKRWFEAPAQVTGQFGGEIYRCERCQTLYLPNAAETPRTQTLSW